MHMTNKCAKSKYRPGSALIFFYLAFLSLAHFHCTPEPQPISYGYDQCIHCKMIISDARYGSELVTVKAKIYTFDSVECLAAYISKKDFVSHTIHSLWVTNFLVPHQLINAKTAVYLHSPQLASPMGLNLTAFSTHASAEEIRRQYPGTVIDWQNVQSTVNQTWMNEGR